MTEKDKEWCEPLESGLASTPRAVAARLGELLTALGRVDSNIIRGTLADDLGQTRLGLHARLKANGWRITAKPNGGWKVLPPLKPRVKR